MQEARFGEAEEIEFFRLLNWKPGKAHDSQTGRPGFLARLAPANTLCTRMQEVGRSESLSKCVSCTVLQGSQSRPPAWCPRRCGDCARLPINLELPRSFGDLPWLDQVILLPLVMPLSVVLLQQKKATVREWGVR